MDKMTYAKALEVVISGGTVTEEVKEKLTALKVSVEKKNASERKPSATQVANEGLKSAILEYMEVGVLYTITDLIKQVPALDGLTNQKVSAIVRQMIPSPIERVEDKRKTYFRKVVG
ncbi:MAG: hypothetical protein IJZ62_04155 [Clostridia bacterium]|nr:hypothetical protein [Clostridia bacterium]